MNSWPVVACLTWLKKVSIALPKKVSIALPLRRTRYILYPGCAEVKSAHKFLKP